MFLREERKLTREEADLLRGQVVARRADLRHTSGCNSGCALFALAFGALLVSRLTVPDHWGFLEVGNAFLKIVGVLVCLWATAYMIKDFLNIQGERRRFERDGVARIEAAVQAGDALALSVTTGEVILIEGVDEDLFTTYVSLGPEGTLVIPGEIEHLTGVWPASQFTVVSSPHYEEWRTFKCGSEPPIRVWRVPVEVLSEAFNQAEPLEITILPGTPEQVIRRLGYDGPIDLVVSEALL